MVLLGLLVCASAHAEKACPADEVTDYLLGLFDTANPKRRMRSVRGLEICKPDGAEGPLLSVLRNDEDVAVRAATARALTNLGSRAAIPVLRRIAADVHTGPETVGAQQHTRAVLTELLEQQAARCDQRTALDDNLPPDQLDGWRLADP